MSQELDGSAEVLRGIWQRSPQGVAERDAECNPNKVCRNMKDVTFDGFAEEGVDMATAWRNKLAREGKLGGSSIADLVFNPEN